MSSQIEFGMNSITLNKFSYFIKGTTGFDSKISEFVSIPRSEMILVKLISKL